MKNRFHLIVVSLICLFVAACSPPTAKDVLARARGAQVEQCKLSGTSRGGVNYRAAKPPSAAMLQALDNGFDRLDKIAAHYNYSNNVTRDKFVVYLMPEERLSLGGVPSLTVAIRCDDRVWDSFCNSDYDKGELPLGDDDLFDQENGKVLNGAIHYITAAERVFTETLGTNSQAFTVVVPKDESEQNLRAVEESEVFGGEHFFNYNNNRELYNATIGSGNDVHPSLPLPDDCECEQ